MSSFDLTSPLVRELRAARPRAPETLRERVTALTQRPAQAPRLGFSLPSRYSVRRVALVAVPVLVAIGVGGAVIHGIANSGSQPQGHAAKEPARRTPPVLDSVAPAPRAVEGGKLRARPSALPPSRSRLQHYEASMTVRVDGLDALSPSTQKAMRIARGLGGYVVSAQFDAAKQGNSALVFRIPIGHVQQAIAKFSALGTIAAQNIRITDLQAQFNQLVKRIGELRVAIAKIDDQLANPSLSNAERVRLEQRRALLTARLNALRTSKARTTHRAALATVSLGLTTAGAAVPAKPHHRGPLGRALHDAGHILAKELSWALYALIVLGPLAAVGLVAFLLVRASRRITDRRLLESS